MANANTSKRPPLLSKNSAAQASNNHHACGTTARHAYNAEPARKHTTSLNGYPAKAGCRACNPSAINSTANVSPAIGHRQTLATSSNTPSTRYMRISSGMVHKLPLTETPWNRGVKFTPGSTNWASLNISSGL
ncbi:hypothetical protein D3C80_1564200 [compost metagenome]